MSDKTVHYVTPACEQYVAYYVEATPKQLMMMDAESLEAIRDAKNDELIEGPHLIIAWAFKEDCVPYPICATIGQGEGAEFVGVTKKEVMDKARVMRKREATFAMIIQECRVSGDDPLKVFYDRYGPNA